MTIALLLAGVLAAAVLHGRSAPQVEALAPGDIVGVYNIRLRGNGFAGDAARDSSKPGRVRGRAVLTIRRQEDETNERGLIVRIDLHPTLAGSLIESATPEPDFLGTATLVGDSLTAIATGRSDYVNALTLRFARRGRVVSGWWLVSLADATATQSSLVTGLGTTFRGRRLKIQPAQLPAVRVLSETR